MRQVHQQQYQRGLRLVFRHGAAAKAFDEALKADPDNAQAYYGRRIVRMCTGQYAAAIADYSSAIRLDPQWFDYKNRAASHEETGDYARALADINEAIALEPKDLVPSVIRAGLYARNGHWDGRLSSASFCGIKRLL
jgi:tetratricopeptide (TPR) repeat protein